MTTTFKQNDVVSFNIFEKRKDGRSSRKARSKFFGTAMIDYRHGLQKFGQPMRADKVRGLYTETKGKGWQHGFSEVVSGNKQGYDTYFTQYKYMESRPDRCDSYKATLKT